MSFKELILIVLGGVLVNNCVFEYFLGAAPLLGAASRKGKNLGLGIAVAAVILCTSLLSWLVSTLVLARLNAGYMQILVFVAITLAVVYLAELLAKKMTQKSLGVYFPIIALNSAVLGTAVNNASAGFLEMLMSSLGVGLGFLGGLLVFSALMGRIDSAALPKPFRGLPIALLAASIVSMALVAFA